MLFDPTPYLNDTINGDKLIQDNYWNDRGKQFNPEKSTVFCKTDYLNDMFEILEQLQCGGITLVTHNSDHGPELYQFPKFVKAWYAQNAKSDRYIPIPIGLERPGIANSGNVQDFIDTNKLRIKKFGLLYVNYSDGTHITRPIIKEHLRQFNWAKVQDNRINFRTYLTELSSHIFCMSPPGNGSDCHRTWEALYMGTIPVCYDNYHNREFARILPIALYSDAGEINCEFLLNAYTEIHNKIQRGQYNFNALTSAYWINKINGHAVQYMESELERHRFIVDIL